MLEELGLHSALRALTAEFTSPALAVGLRLDPGLPALDEQTELVLYRVAQEGLTNTARHAGAGRVDLRLERTDDGARLTVRDDGMGLGGAQEGAGIRGMRERALLVSARLTLGPGPGGGTEVRLDVPVREEDR